MKTEGKHLMNVKGCIPSQQNLFTISSKGTTSVKFIKDRIPMMILQEKHKNHVSDILHRHFGLCTPLFKWDSHFFLRYAPLLQVFQQHHF